MHGHALTPIPPPPCSLPQQMSVAHARAVVAAAVLVWLQIAVQATGDPSPSCPTQAGPEKMVVVLAPSPYFSWKECNEIGHLDGTTYPTEAINETKHAGVVTRVKKE